jgi:hypothetical protein
MHPSKAAVVAGFLVLGVLFTGCEKFQKKADLVLINGTILTLDETQPEAEALAVKGDRIVAVGRAEEVKKYIRAGTKVIDLRGRVAIPGFIESHAHFMGLGRAKMQLDLTKARSWEEIVEMVREAAAKARPGEWITGRGWHQEKWERTPQPNIDGLPFHYALSQASPDNPVLLTHASGHSCIANAKAMELAGIARETPDPPGGEIVRDARGNPIGVFRETAQGLIGRAMQKWLNQLSAEEREARRVKMVELAVEECLKNGITTFHDAGEPFETIDFLKQMVDEGKLKIRLYVMVSGSSEVLRERLKDYRLIGYGNHHLTVRAIKAYVDGALGSHGAWLLEPYADLPSSVGLNTTPLEELRNIAIAAIEHDFQLCIHAIGDRGNREVLNLYESVFKEHPEKKDLRWRIEHAQHLHPQDIPRFAALGVIAAMQGVHCTSDGPWVIKRLGEKRAREGAYVWQSLLKTGAVICNGTDAPVEDVNPIASFYASVTRRMANGKQFFPEQAMTREQALKSYTLNGAYAAFEEKLKGSLEPGKLADITVLSQNLLTVPEDQILNTRVVYTIVGGKVLYAAEDIR